MLYDVDIDASACILSSRYAMLLYEYIGLQFTDSLLLSPANGITVKQDKQIKAALFQFIEDTHRKL